MDDAFWQSFFSFLEKIGLLLIPLFAVYLGWKLSRKSYIEQISLDYLRQRFDALRQIKSEVKDIWSPDISRQELVEKLNGDAAYRKDCSERLIRLFGLRNELIPYIEPEFVNLIDGQLKQLFDIETGKYTFREEKVEELVAFTETIISQVDAVEKALTQEYKKHFE